MRINSRLQRRWGDIYSMHAEKASMNSSVFNWNLKILGDGKDLVANDKPFQMHGAAIEKALSEIANELWMVSLINENRLIAAIAQECKASIPTLYYNVQYVVLLRCRIVLHN